MSGLQHLLVSVLLACSPAFAGSLDEQQVLTEIINHLTPEERDSVEQSLSGGFSLTSSPDGRHYLTHPDSADEECSTLPGLMRTLFQEKPSLQQLLIILNTVINERDSAEQKKNPEVKDSELWGMGRFDHH